MAALTIQLTNLTTGITETLVSAGALGDTIEDDGFQRTVLEVVNGSGVSINVTIALNSATMNIPGIGIHTVGNRVIAVGAGVTRIIGPFPREFIGAGGLVTITYSAVTSVTVRALKVPRLD